MSQAAAQKKIKLDDERVKVLAHFQTSGSVLRGSKAGECQGFDVELDVESQESSRVIDDLLRIARQMCFTEQVLTNRIELRITARLNGRPL